MRNSYHCSYCDTDVARDNVFDHVEVYHVGRGSLKRFYDIVCGSCGYRVPESQGQKIAEHCIAMNHAGSKVTTDWSATVTIETRRVLNAVSATIDMIKDNQNPGAMRSTVSQENDYEMEPDHSLDNSSELEAELGNVQNFSKKKRSRSENHFTPMKKRKLPQSTRKQSYPSTQLRNLSSMEDLSSPEHLKLLPMAEELQDQTSIRPKRYSDEKTDSNEWEGPSPEPTKRKEESRGRKKKELKAHKLISFINKPLVPREYATLEGAIQFKIKLSCSKCQKEFAGYCTTGKLRYKLVTHSIYHSKFSFFECGKCNTQFKYLEGFHTHFNERVCLSEWEDPGSEKSKALKNGAGLHTDEKISRIVEILRECFPAFDWEKELCKVKSAGLHFFDFYSKRKMKTEPAPTTASLTWKSLMAQKARGNSAAGRTAMKPEYEAGDESDSDTENNTLYDVPKKSGPPILTPKSRAKTSRRKKHLGETWSDEEASDEEEQPPDLSRAESRSASSDDDVHNPQTRLAPTSPHLTNRIPGSGIEIKTETPESDEEPSKETENECEDYATSKSNLKSDIPSDDIPGSLEIVDAKLKNLTIKCSICAAHYSAGTPTLRLKLLNHGIAHSKLIFYDCPICGVDFKTHVSLVKHTQLQACKEVKNPEKIKSEPVLKEDEKIKKLVQQLYICFPIIRWRIELHRILDVGIDFKTFFKILEESEVLDTRKSTSTLMELARLRSQLDSKRRQVCHICGKAFQGPRKMDRIVEHMTEHADIKFFQCLNCEFESVKPEEMTKVHKPSAIAKAKGCDGRYRAKNSEKEISRLRKFLKKGFPSVDWKFIPEFVSAHGISL